MLPFYQFDTNLSYNMYLTALVFMHYFFVLMHLVQTISFSKVLKMVNCYKEYLTNYHRLPVTILYLHIIYYALFTIILYFYQPENLQC